MVRENLRQSVTIALKENIRVADKELNKLLQDETGHPITYNHYYTDNIQKARHDRAKRLLKDSMQNAIREDWDGRFHFNNSTEEINRLVTALQDRVVVDMGERACSEAQTDLDAYYKVRIHWRILTLSESKLILLGCYENFRRQCLSPSR